jgi:cation diffusion facilitator CzcD-associated flavoprotein CzcO
MPGSTTRWRSHPRLAVDAGQKTPAPTRFSVSVKRGSQRALTDVFERHDAIGRIWDPTNVGTPMHESAHLFSSCDMSAYHGYKVPADYPDYPRHNQILAYVRGFAANYHLTGHVHLGLSGRVAVKGP